jgi:hypothetical protein
MRKAYETLREEAKQTMLHCRDNATYESAEHQFYYFGDLLASTKIRTSRAKMRN